MKREIYTHLAAIPLKPHGSCKIHIGFHNMPPCALRYELDAKDGTVTADGVYTASDRQGVHVIRVMCESDPHIHTFAYTDVQK